MAQVDFEELERLAQALSRAAEPGAIEYELDNTAALLAELEAAGGDMGKLSAMTEEAAFCLERMKRDRVELRRSLDALSALVREQRSASLTCSEPEVFSPEFFEADAEEGHFSAVARAKLLSSSSKKAMDNKKKAAQQRQAGKTDA